MWHQTAAGAASTPEKLLKMFSSNVVIMETEAFVVSEARRRHSVKKRDERGLGSCAAHIRSTEYMQWEAENPDPNNIRNYSLT